MILHGAVRISIIPPLINIYIFHYVSTVINIIFHIHFAKMICGFVRSRKITNFTEKLHAITGCNDKPTVILDSSYIVHFIIQVTHCHFSYITEYDRNWLKPNKYKTSLYKIFISNWNPINILSSLHKIFYFYIEFPRTNKKSR